MHYSDLKNQQVSTKMQDNWRNIVPQNIKIFHASVSFLNDTFKPDILMSRQTQWHISIQNSMQASFAEMSAYYESEMLEILCSLILKHEKIFFYFNFLPSSKLWIIIFAGILSGFEMPYERYKNDIFYVNVWFLWTVDVLCVLSKWNNVFNVFCWISNINWILNIILLKNITILHGILFSRISEFIHCLRFCPDTIMQKYFHLQVFVMNVDFSLISNLGKFGFIATR